MTPIKLGTGVAYDGVPKKGSVQALNAIKPWSLVTASHSEVLFGDTNLPANVYGFTAAQRVLNDWFVVRSKEGERVANFPSLFRLGISFLGIKWSEIDECISRIPEHGLNLWATYIDSHGRKLTRVRWGPLHGFCTYKYAINVDREGLIEVCEFTRR